jgi:hypothetical protein
VNRIAQSVYRLGYGLDDQGIRVKFLAGLRDFLFSRIQTDSGAHTVTHPVGAGGLFPRGKQARK